MTKNERTSAEVAALAGKSTKRKRKAKARKRNERTSARVARIAGSILAELSGEYHVSPSRLVYFVLNGKGELYQLSATVGDLKALAASALTQTRDRGKR